jgi:NAD(P)-dependent dehydrogenase (short-subunit alcohol dehydrogenase family)
MRILVIGANGTIGKIVTAELQKNHEVVAAGRSTGEIQVDISSIESIEKMFQMVKNIDACICTAGDSETADIQNLTAEHLKVGINQKLLGQANLVLIGQKYLNDGGSFTLISGKMGDLPAQGATGKSFVNGAVNSFVKASALDLGRGLRINAVSPAKIGSVPDEDVAKAFRQAVEGDANGEIFRIY